MSSCSCHFHLHLRMSLIAWMRRILTGGSLRTSDLGLWASGEKATWVILLIHGAFIIVILPEYLLSIGTYHLAVVVELIQCTELASKFALFDWYTVVSEVDIHLVEAILAIVVNLIRILFMALEELIIIVETIVFSIWIGLSLALFQISALLVPNVSSFFVFGMWRSWAFLNQWGFKWSCMTTVWIAVGFDLVAFILRSVNMMWLIDILVDYVHLIWACQIDAFLSSELQWHSTHFT